MSVQTEHGERIKILEINHDNLKEKVDDLKEVVTPMKTLVTEMRVDLRWMKWILVGVFAEGIVIIVQGFSG